MRYGRALFRCSFDSKGENELILFFILYLGYNRNNLDYLLWLWQTLQQSSLIEGRCFRAGKGDIGLFDL